MINLYMSSATFGTNNNDTMHVCQIKTEEKSKLVIIKLSVQLNSNSYHWFVKCLKILLLQLQQLEYHYSAIRHGNNKRVKLKRLTTWKNLNLLWGAINHAFIQAIKFNLQRGFQGAHLRNARFANHD